MATKFVYRPRARSKAPPTKKEAAGQADIPEEVPGNSLYCHLCQQPGGTLMKDPDEPKKYVHKACKISFTQSQKDKASAED